MRFNKRSKCVDEEHHDNHQYVKTTTIPKEHDAVSKTICTYVLNPEVLELPELELF